MLCVTHTSYLWPLDMPLRVVVDEIMLPTKSNLSSCFGVMVGVGREV